MSKDSSKMIGFLLTEVAMGLLDYKYFDLDGRPVHDLQSLTKFSRDEEDYIKNETNLTTLLNTADQAMSDVVIDLDEIEDSNEMETNVETNDQNVLDTNQKEPPSVHETDESFDAKLANSFPNIESKDSVSEPVTPDCTNEPDVEESKDLDKPSTILSKLTSKSDRVKFLTDLTHYEFLKLKQVSNRRRRSYMTNKSAGKPNEALDMFYKQEKRKYEAESDALISFIKVVKKSEFSPDNDKLVKLISQISNDIMETKKSIDWKKFV